MNEPWPTDEDAPDLPAPGRKLSPLADEVSRVERLPRALGLETTELANAERYVREHGDDLRFVHPWTAWLAWDGRRWARDATAEAQRRGQLTVRALWEDVAIFAKAGDAASRTAMEKHARASEREPAIRHMLDLAAARLPLTPESLDRDRHLLSVANGTIDLRSGELREHDRGDFITHLVPHRYEPAAAAPRWARFVCEVLDGREDLVTFLRRWCGYCLTAETREHAMVLAVGGGANGKSVLVETLQHVLGADIAAPAPPGLLLTDRNGRHPTEVWALRGRRLVVANEVPSGATFAEERLKWLTGGDSLSARAMRQDFATFAPTHKLIVAANHMPRVRDTSDGFWRRMRVVPFDVSFRDRADPHLTETLRAEAEGILAWCIVGAIEWYASGLGEPVVVREATERYRGSEDTVGRWLETRTERGLGGDTAKALRQDFATWAEAEGERALSAKALAAELQRRGWSQSRTESARRWEPTASP